MIRTRIWSVFVVSAILAGAAGESSVVLAQRQPAAAAARPAAAETTPDDRIARGRYIVEDVATCWRCHSPVLQNGERDDALADGWPGWRHADGAVGQLGNCGAPYRWRASRHRRTDRSSADDRHPRNGGRLRLPMPQFRMSRQTRKP